MAHRIVGLDIGTSAIRAVELSVDEGARPVLLAFGQVGLRPGTIVDGEVRDRSQVVLALQRLWKEGGFDEHQVRMGVAGLRAITREIDMPPIPPDELDDAVRFQSDQVVPFPLEQTTISAKVMAQFTDADGAPQMRVLVAAAHRDLIDGMVAAVREAGLQPVGIDLDTAALARALYDPAAGDAPAAIVSVGAGLTMVVVHQGGQLQFVRTIDLGGETITLAIASALDLPVADAESLKRDLAAPGLHDARAESAAAAAVGDLVAEIHNSIRFFSSLPGRAAPARLEVTGGGALVAGFLDALQAGLEVQVVPASPLSRVDTGQLPISPEQSAAINPTLAVPVGLAMPDPAGQPFNLLPPEVRAEYAERRARRILVGIGVLLLLLVIGGTVWRVLAVRDAEHQISAMTSKLAYINHVEIPRYDKVVHLQAEVRTLQVRLEPLVAGEVDWLVVLNQLGQYMPSTSVLTGLDLTATGTPGAPSPASTSASASTQAIGTGSGSAVVPNLTAFSQFGDSMSQSPALVLGAPSGTLTNNSSIDFDITFSVNREAGSQRVGRFTQEVP